MLRTIGLIVAAIVLGAGAAVAETLRARAVLAEPLADAEGLTLEATVSDVSRADAPSIFLAGVSFLTSGQPGYEFSITYDPAELQPQAVYALRVALSRDGHLVASTDTHYPVLEGGAAGAEPIEVLLHPVR
jgi:putative lipoprotein